MTAPELSVVIVSYNSGKTLPACLKSIEATVSRSHEVIVVDNGSSDGSLERVRADFPGVQVVEGAANRGYAAANNSGLGRARGAWAALVNPDIELLPDALDRLISTLEATPQLAAAGPALVWPEGEPQPYSHGGDPSPAYLLQRALTRLAGRSLHRWAGGPTRTVDWVSGACLVARRSALEQVGGLDEDFFLYFEDVDLGRRLRQRGWRIAFVPSATAVHHSRPSYADRKRRERYQRSLLRYYGKHYGALATWSLRLSLAVVAHLPTEGFR